MWSNQCTRVWATLYFLCVTSKSCILQHLWDWSEHWVPCLWWSVVSSTERNKSIQPPTKYWLTSETGSSPIVCWILSRGRERLAGWGIRRVRTSVVWTELNSRSLCRWWFLPVLVAQFLMRGRVYVCQTGLTGPMTELSGVTPLTSTGISSRWWTSSVLKRGRDASCTRLVMFLVPTEHSVHCQIQATEVSLWCVSTHQNTWRWSPPHVCVTLHVQRLV